MSSGAVAAGEQFPSQLNVPNLHSVPQGATVFGAYDSIDQEMSLLQLVAYSYVYVYIYTFIYIPVVPHKAVAEVSKIGNL